MKKLFFILATFSYFSAWAGKLNIECRSNLDHPKPAGSSLINDIKGIEITNDESDAKMLLPPVNKDEYYDNVLYFESLYINEYDQRIKFTAACTNAGCELEIYDTKTKNGVTSVGFFGSPKALLSNGVDLRWVAQRKDIRGYSLTCIKLK